MTFFVAQDREKSTDSAAQPRSPLIQSKVQQPSLAETESHVRVWPIRLATGQESIDSVEEATAYCLAEPDSSVRVRVWLCETSNSPGVHWFSRKSNSPGIHWFSWKTNNHSVPLSSGHSGSTLSGGGTAHHACFFPQPTTAVHTYGHTWKRIRRSQDM